MSTIPVQCGQCNRRFAAKPQLAGKRVKCPECQNPIEVPDPNLIAAVIATVEVKCSMCQNEYLAESSDVGRQVPCPSCGMLNAVTGGGTAGHDEYRLQAPMADNTAAQAASPFGGPSRRATAPPMGSATFRATASSGGSNILARHWLSAVMAVLALISLMLCLVAGHPAVGVLMLGAGIAVAGSGFVFPPPARRRKKKSSDGTAITFMSSAAGVIFFVALAVVRVLSRMNRRGQLDGQEWVGPALAVLFGLILLAGLIGLFVWIVSRLGIFRAGAVFYGLFAVGVPVLLLSLDPGGLGGNGKGGGIARRELPKPLAETEMPNLGVPRPIGTGVDFYEVYLPVPPSQPGHANKLFVYVPQGNNSPRSRPCVFIAGAGATPFTGMDLGTADQPEHIPYAEQGFVVVAYEIDGCVADPDSASDEEFLKAIEDYWSADVGLVNARNAIDFALARIPAVDPERLYTAGHSSAASQALLLAENEPRIRGCVAYAPVVNLQTRLGGDLRIYRSMIDDFDTLLKRASPWENEAGLHCPTMLFHAVDDQNVPVSESRGFAARLERARKPVTLVTVGRGGHYDSMISEGIPRGIEWLRKQAGVGTQSDVAVTTSAGNELASNNSATSSGSDLPSLGMGGLRPGAGAGATTSSGRSTLSESDPEDPFAESGNTGDARMEEETEDENPFREISADSDSPFKEVPADDAAAGVSGRELDRLLAKMSGSMLEQRAALKELATKSPEGLSPEAREKAVDKLNELAVGADTFTRRDAIEALGTWGDEGSARVLVGILLDGRNRSLSADVYKTLGKLKDPSSAIAVAERLDDFFDADKAEACLRSMGALSEDALIAIAPTAKRDGCVRALRLLGEFGTEKCLNVLRQAQESRDPVIRQMGKAAIRAVRLRERAEEEGGSENEG